MVLNSKLILKSSNFFSKQDISNDWPVVLGVVFLFFWTISWCFVLFVSCNIV